MKGGEHWIILESKNPKESSYIPTVDTCSFNQQLSSSYPVLDIFVDIVMKSEHDEDPAFLDKLTREKAGKEERKLRPVLWSTFRIWQ